VTISKPIYGITGALGYEYMDRDGYFVRPTIGYTGITTQGIGSSSDGVVAFGIALGYKFW